jgi:hypothetical protein
MLLAKLRNCTIRHFPRPRRRGVTECHETFKRPRQLRQRQTDADREKLARRLAPSTASNPGTPVVRLWIGPPSLLGTVSRSGAGYGRHEGIWSSCGSPRRALFHQSRCDVRAKQPRQELEHALEYRLETRRHSTCPVRLDARRHVECRLRLRVKANVADGRVRISCVREGAHKEGMGAASAKPNRQPSVHALARSLGGRRRVRRATLGSFTSGQATRQFPCVRRLRRRHVRGVRSRDPRPSHPMSSPKPEVVAPRTARLVVGGRK